MVGYGNSAIHDGFDTIDFVGHDLGSGVGLRYAARTPEAVDRLVLSNSVAYDSWPIQTITDLGLPETARETSVEELQEMLDGLFASLIPRAMTGPDQL
ncbi:alpha/beta fold hydrolase [Halorubrum sp. DTA98]|uniref:alpha/beta fold hydrolase n=1 Tax=Halorubrum sp. DTA98 TaxID=3402163 RepID=UPI003AADAA1E